MGRRGRGELHTTAISEFGLDYDSLVDLKPDLVMVSACLNGQTGPTATIPASVAGLDAHGLHQLTGWPDREPVGPSGTITDSLAPRFVATALAATLWYRRRTGRGAYLDLSQVETAIFSLAPWLLTYAFDGRIELRDGNRRRGSVPHGAFPCADEGEVGDRWVAIACHDDADWAALTARHRTRRSSLAGVDARVERQDEIEALVARWTSVRTRADVASRLQAEGIEAVPVQDYGDLHDDPQLAARGHFESHEHPFLGTGCYERNGFRISAASSGYDRAGPTLGQDTDWVLGEVLALDAAAIDALRASARSSR